MENKIIMKIVWLLIGAVCTWEAVSLSFWLANQPSDVGVIAGLAVFVATMIGAYKGLMGLLGE